MQAPREEESITIIAILLSLCIVCIIYLCCPILEIAVRRSHLNAVRFIRIPTSASVSTLLEACLRALVSQPSPDQRTRASDGRYIFKTLYTRPPRGPEVKLCVMVDNRFLVGRGVGCGWHHPVVLASSEAREDWVRVRLRGERLGRGWHWRLSVSEDAARSHNRPDKPDPEPEAGPGLVSLVWVRSCLAQCAIAPGRCPIWAGHCQIVAREYLKY